MGFPSFSSTSGPEPPLTQPTTTVTTTGTVTDARVARFSISPPYQPSLPRSSPLLLLPLTPSRLHSPWIRDTTSSLSAAVSTQTDSLTTLTLGLAARPRTSELLTDTPPRCAAPTPSRSLILVILAKL